MQKISTACDRGNVPRVGEETENGIELKLTKNLNPHVSEPKPTLANGLVASLDVQVEPNLPRDSAPAGCKWNIGAAILFVAHTVLLVLSLILHPVRECPSGGVLT